MEGLKRAMTVAHQRKRQILTTFLKKMKFSPVVSIQGPRQCGKSYFARELLPQRFKKAMYFSLDKKELRTYAESKPHSFLMQTEDRPLVIDEAQKAPDLFDEIKSLVDEKRAPGQFVILGSTEFSLETKVRESLTGRLSRIRLFPFNLSESLKLDLALQKNFPYPKEKPRATRSELLRYLNRGGFPGIFNIHSEEERISALGDWLSLTTERDIHQFKKFKLDSEICYSVLESIAKLDEANGPAIARQVKQPLKVVNKYLKVLKILFVIFDAVPMKGSTGKPIYFLTDTGLLEYFKVNLDKKLLTWFYLEIYSQLSYMGAHLRPLNYFRTTKGKFIDLVFEITDDTVLAIKVLFKEGFDKRDFLIFESLEKKIGNKRKLQKILLSGASNKFKFEEYVVYPWESLA